VLMNTIRRILPPIRKRTLSTSVLNVYVWRFFRAIILVGLCFMIVFPILYKLSNSFKGYADLSDPTVFFIPRSISLITYKTVWESIHYPTALLSSIAVCALVALLTTASCTFISYGFARFQFWGKQLLFALVILILVIPPQAILFPLYLKFKFFSVTSFLSFSGVLSGSSLIDTLWPFIMLSMTGLSFKGGLYIYLLRQYFINVPVAIEEAAYIDGCNHFRTFRTIMLPGATPMIVTVFLFSFVWQWTDFYYSTMLAPNMPTINMQLFGFSSRLIADHGNLAQNFLQSPQFVLLIFPLVFLYIFTQRYFVESIEKSGIVG
jgi:multiple sugar transport system permease protein